jgi:multiple sugar transport system permease protein
MRSKRARAEALEGYLWISPWLVGLLVFTAGPIIASLYLSFTKYKIGDIPQWLGLANYKEALTADTLFWPSLWRTAYYTLFNVLLGVSGSLIVAVILAKVVRGRASYRALYYLPSLPPAVATAILWGWLLHPQVGLVNDMLRHVGVKGPGWLTSTVWAIPSIILISLWSSIGGGRMIIFLAGLQGVPTELYEASDIDGASATNKFWHITLPLISPTFSSTRFWRSSAVSACSPSPMWPPMAARTMPLGSICCTCTITPLATFRWAMPARWRGFCLSSSSRSRL